ncbi:hypothetical protein B0J13DRAFT_124827 [Dactylonectria estremocensis]|uniref:MARVEL domain-containing protein n=1 Tax=Dactylonectria estremocensis TaxID=1079267 RepID=A0A9P9JIK5_9HYPO|nr:hypothetical protein B0J13DRAFT_124827 [Dactylonectria estremocensis]
MTTTATTTTGTQGLTATGVPPLPFFVTIIRGVIIVFSLGALIAAAYNLSLFGGASLYLSGYSGPAGFIIFDAIFTFLIVGGMLVSEFFAPQLYYRIAFIIGLILNAIFWLSAWAWAASVASSFFSYYNSYDGYYRSKSLDAYGGSMAACAALGAVVWVLVIVTIVFFIKSCMASPQSQTYSPRTEVQAELGEPKPEGQQYPPQQYPPQQYPPQQYPPQQYPPQPQQ